jgi:phage terminase large subunit-like protein
LTWPNGCIAQGFSAEEPDRLRGPQEGFAWADEPAHFPLAQQVWDNLLFGLRMKETIDGLPFKPHVVATSTPKPTRFVKDLVKDPTTVVKRVSTYENLDNLADTFKSVILDRYEGTRLGRQELHGEVLEDVEGALWTWDMFQWIEEAPPLTRIVVGVDPAGTANAKSDETGIITVGIDAGKNLFVLDDVSGRYSPEGWGSRSNSQYEDYSADAIVPEKNYGADMVKYVLENAGYTGAYIKPVQSRRGKQIRAEPIVALYEKKRVYHVGRRGDLSILEDELTTWVSGEGESPNRLDALVHACTELAKHAMPASVADPTTLLSGRSVRHLRVVGG